MVHFVIHHNTKGHEFYLSRHGQSEYNAIGRIGGDSGGWMDGWGHWLVVWLVSFFLSFFPC